MKPLNLKFGSIKEMLSKEQMKQISGGSTCTYYWHEGDGCAGGSDVVDSNQTDMDYGCSINDCCDDADCP